MADEAALAAEYRKHAKALRAAAKFDEHAKTSLILKRIAEDYELMARALESVDGRGGPVDRSRMRERYSR